jgi:4-alpha-glucanotransferase
MHPTSLPGRYGIGSFNQSAFNWIDFLHAHDQSIWQILPLGPTGYGDSPYACRSSFAGNTYMISLEKLVDKGLLDSSELQEIPEFDPAKVNFELIYNWKLPLLRKMAAGHYRDAPQDFHHFCTKHRHWLDDYTLFLAISQHHPEMAWNQWELPLRTRQPEALAKAREDFSEDIGIEKFLQWIFFEQWGEVKDYANQRGIQIFGDLPIFAALDSADAWCHPELFYFDENLQPTLVAGVPPDLFSDDGQLWGNPLYKWEAHEESGYAWWIDRLKACYEMYDIVRIDHFRGFAGYWEIKAGATTAREGRWVKGPGIELFKAFEHALGNRHIIAEDLGEITPDVIYLRDQLELPGMKILQFAFANGPTDPFLPHNHAPNFVVYTGTHDNNTVRGWYEHDARADEKEYFENYMCFQEKIPSRAMLRSAMRSVCVLAITPLQDLLNLGKEARMNFPGQVWDNWQWRLVDGQLEDHYGEFLKELTHLYGRSPIKA